MNCLFCMCSNNYTFYIQLIIVIQKLCLFDVGDCGVMGIDVIGFGIWCWCLWGLRNGCVSGSGEGIGWQEGIG